jgi:hypothetical protein
MRVDGRSRIRGNNLVPPPEVVVAVLSDICFWIGHTGGVVVGIVTVLSNYLNGLGHRDHESHIIISIGGIVVSWVLQSVRSVILTYKKDTIQILNRGLRKPFGRFLLDICIFP